MKVLTYRLVTFTLALVILGLSMSPAEAAAPHAAGTILYIDDDNGANNLGIVCASIITREWWAVNRALQPYYRTPRSSWMML